MAMPLRIDPKHLPTSVISYDHSPLTSGFISNLQASSYFSLVDTPNNEQQARQKLATGKISFIITIPVNFTHDFVHTGQNSNAGHAAKYILSAAFHVFVWLCVFFLWDAEMGPKHRLLCPHDLFLTDLSGGNA